MKIELERGTILRLLKIRKFEVTEVGDKFYIDADIIQTMVEILLEEIEHQEEEIQNIENERDEKYRTLTSEEQYG